LRALVLVATVAKHFTVVVTPNDLVVNTCTAVCAVACNIFPETEESFEALAHRLPEVLVLKQPRDIADEVVQIEADGVGLEYFTRNELEPPPPPPLPMVPVPAGPPRRVPSPTSPGEGCRSGASAPDDSDANAE
tara:strand:+ start:968 stop:1369 length:402 start_codon:yes stop_codon:yes gene_type:complete